MPSLYVFLTVLINHFAFLINTSMRFVFMMKCYEQLLWSSMKLIVKCLKRDESSVPTPKFGCQRCKGGVHYLVLKDKGGVNWFRVEFRILKFSSFNFEQGIQYGYGPEYVQSFDTDDKELLMSLPKDKDCWVVERMGEGCDNTQPQGTNQRGLTRRNL